MTEMIDLSHTVESGMITYKGLPASVICDYLSREASRKLYAQGTEFSIGRMDMVGNTGTYLDSPFHRYADGKDLSQLPLTSLANLDCVIAHIEPGRSRVIDRLPFSPVDVRGKAVLIHTGWDRHWRTDSYFEGFPHLTGMLARWLCDAGAILVGIDSHNIDCTDTGERPVRHFPGAGFRRCRTLDCKNAAGLTLTVEGAPDDRRVIAEWAAQHRQISIPPPGRKSSTWS